MQFKITGNEFNYKNFMKSFDGEDNVLEFDSKNNELIIHYNSAEDYEQILYNCGGFIAFEMFTASLLRKLRAAGFPTNDIVDIFSDSNVSQNIVPYISLNIFKLLRRYLEGETHLNVDAFKKFRVKGMEEETDIYMAMLERMRQMDKSLSGLDTSSVDELRMELEIALASGGDLGIILPLVAKIYEKEQNHPIIDFHITKKEGIPMIINERGTILSLELLLDRVHPGISFEVLGGREFDEYINNIALMVYIVQPERLIHYSKTFTAKENSQINSIFNELKHDFPKIDIYQGGS